VVATDPEWHSPLPLTRPGLPAAVVPLCYGEYFSSIKHFLSADNGRGLVGALSRRLGRAVTWADIDAIHICVQKHGAFYHPARVDVFLGNMPIAFVVNVAVLPGGQAGLDPEYRLMNRLNDIFPRGHIPVVYHQGFGAAFDDSRRLPMFLGEWLSGYHEFHIDTVDRRPQTIRIWSKKETRLRTPEQKALLYCRVSEILTDYYNPETFEQVFPWHHGAGDFVVRLTDNDLEVRLITVRRYASMVDADSGEPAAVLEAAVRFFLHLSLRMRIDRIDGTGDLVWADEAAVDGCVTGFFNGLALKNRIAILPVPLVDTMVYYLSRLTRSDFTQALADILASYPRQAPERSLMASHLASHSKALFSCVDRILAEM